MNMANCAVIGQGFVGGSLATVLREKGVKCLTYDKAGKASDATSAYPTLAVLVSACRNVALFGGEAFSGIYFVCLPTPMNADGSCNTSIVEETIKELCSICSGKCYVVVKSTVPPGSVERWNSFANKHGVYVIFNPEFLREASALDDMRNQDRIILGGPRPHVDVVRDFYRTVFPDVPLHKTSSSIAELVKYTTNCFLATKVSFANEMYQLCEALSGSGLDVDYDRVIELATLDARLGKSHWRVPGPMPADDGTGRLLRGYGGSCFIKDLNAIISVAKELGIDPKVMIAAWEKNLEVRPERDWEKLKGRAVVEKDDV
jgi:UDPglucose 6-dehydrogenase